MIETYPNPKLITVCFEAPFDNDPKQGLAVAVLADGNVLVQMINERGVHSVILPRTGAIGLIAGLSRGLGGATEQELAPLRAVIEEQWAGVPKA
jgi:hypothetical protein